MSSTVLTRPKPKRLFNRDEAIQEIFADSDSDSEDFDPSEGKNTECDRHDRCRLADADDSEFYTWDDAEFDPEAELDIVQGINGEAEVDTEEMYEPPAMEIQQEDEEGRKLFVLYWFSVTADLGRIWKALVQLLFGENYSKVPH